MYDHRSKNARQYDKERHERIVALYEELGDVDEVADRLALARRTVMVHTRGIRPAPPQTVRHTQEEWDAVERWLIEEEGSYAEAARTFGISAKHIARRFPELGWRRPDAGRWAGQINRIAKRFEKATYANS